MALRPKGTFDATVQAQDLRFYRTDDGEGGTEVHVTGLYEDSEGRVYSASRKLADCSDAAQRQAVKAISDVLAGDVVAAHMEDV